MCFEQIVSKLACFNERIKPGTAMNSYWWDFFKEIQVLPPSLNVRLVGWF